MVLTAICLLTAHASTTLDYDPPRVSWMGWSVGYEYHGGPYSLPAHRYFIGNMLDGDPATAWMVGGTLIYDERLQKEVPDFTETVIPELFIVLPKVTKIDGVRIMPGYNKSPEVFKRHHRILGLTLYSDKEQSAYAYIEEPFVTGKLKDEMGWQEIHFAPRTMGTLKLRVSDWAKGTDNDFCISEIQLLSDGKPVEWNVTPVLMSTIGSDCG